MDPNTAMETIGAGAKAATKLGEIVEKVFNPHWTRKQADADEYADNKKLQTIRDNPDMQIVYIDGKLNARERTPEALAIRAEQRMLSEAIRQEENIEKVFDVAANDLASAESVSEKPVDEDWITRFFNIAKDVSNEEMQYLWGKILSGEIKQPGSFSLRTLETIRNLSKEEAETFQKILPFIMTFGEKGFITSDQSLLKEFGILFADILSLEECGLINRDLTYKPTVTSDEHTFFYSSNIYVKFSGYSQTHTNITIHVHMLSAVGYELYRILFPTANKEYSIKWAEKIFCANNKNVLISLHDVSKSENGTISFFAEPFKIFDNNKPNQNIEHIQTNKEV